MSEDKVITIPLEEYEALKEDAAWLRALEEAGFAPIRVDQDILEEME